jgi:hypothetical protein
MYSGTCSKLVSESIDLHSLLVNEDIVPLECYVLGSAFSGLSGFS